MAFVLLDLKKKFYSQYAYYENPVSFWSSSLFHHSIPSQRWTQFSMMCHDATFSDHVIIGFFLLLLSRITLKLCPKQRSAHVPYLTPWPQRFDYAMTAPSSQLDSALSWTALRQGKMQIPFWVCKFCQIWIKSTFGMKLLKQFAEQEKNRDTIHCKVCTVHYKYI